MRSQKIVCCTDNLGLFKFKSYNKRDIYDKIKQDFAKDGFILEETTDSSGVELQLKEGIMSLSSNFSAAKDFLELIIYSLTVSGLTSSHTKMKSVSKLSTANKNIHQTSLVLSDPLGKALESYTQPTIHTLCTSLQSLIGQIFLPSITYIINKPIDLKNWMAALLIYTYIFIDSISIILINSTSRLSELFFNGPIINKHVKIFECVCLAVTKKYIYIYI